jgi:hypothetical protein
MISDNIEYEINTQIYLSADDSSMGGSHHKKVSENETRMYTLCTLNGKELDTGHNSSPNSELSY